MIEQVAYLFQFAVGTSDVSTALWGCVFGLAGAIAALAAYVRKILGDHKDEVKALTEAHAGRIEALMASHSDSLRSAYENLSNEKTARREEMAGFLKEVIETANSMSRSVDANTDSQRQLVELIDRWISTLEEIRKTLIVLAGKVEEVSDKLEEQQ